MIFEAGTGAVREVVMVFAIAVAGLLLAVVAAFAPWYDGGLADRGTVVEMRAPDATATGTTTQVTAHEGSTARPD